MVKTRMFVTIGSWILIALGLLQLFGYVRSSAEPEEGAEAQAPRSAITCRVDLTGEERPAADLFAGYSLSTTVLLVFAGLAALSVSRSEDVELLRSTVVRYTGMTGLLAVISLANLYGVPTVGLGLCFAAYAAALLASGRERGSAGLSNSMN